MIKRKPTMLVPNKSDIDLEWTNRNKINQNEPVCTHLLIFIENHPKKKSKFQDFKLRYDEKFLTDFGLKASLRISESSAYI